MTVSAHPPAPEWRPIGPLAALLVAKVGKPGS